MKIEIKKLRGDLVNEDFQYMTDGAVGIDLRVCTFDGQEIEEYYLKEGDTVKVGTGFSINMLSAQQKGLGAVILPRSGLGSNKGIVLGNLVGLIDTDYQGELIVCLWNRSETYRFIKQYDRIAQLAFIPFIKPEFEIVEEFTVASKRGSDGFGSTGSK